MKLINELVEFSKIKMVVFDLDGTLLNSKSDLSEATINAIVKIKKKGIKTVIASGRIYPMLQSYIKRLGVVDYVISANGASIDYVRDHKSIEHIYVLSKDAKKVVEFSRERHIECLILKRNVSYHPNPSERLEKFISYNDLSKMKGYEPMKLEIYDESFNDYEHIEKILINEKDQLKIEELVRFIELSTNLKHTKSGKLLLDISSQGVSKEEALKKVCKLEKITLNEVIAFGDYDNDVGMLKESGFSIAPKNASFKALEAADYITLSNDEDGVAHVLNILLKTKI